MSTRSQIGFYRNEPNLNTLKNFDALLYRHSDGYPSGVLPNIIPFLKWWKTARGLDDIEYCAARLLQYLCNEYDGRGRNMEKILGKNTDYTGIYGHGICKFFHGDIEYYYAIYPNKLQVYSMPYDEKPENWKLLGTIDLEKCDNLDEIISELDKKGA